MSPAITDKGDWRHGRSTISKSIPPAAHQPTLDVSPRARYSQSTQESGALNKHRATMRD